MISKLHFLILLCFLFSISNCCSQEKQFVKEWKLEYIQTNGVKEITNSASNLDVITFKDDGTFLSIDQGEETIGFWFYEESNRSIILDNDNFPEEGFVMKVIKISENNLVLEAVSIDKKIKRIFMKATPN